MPKVKTLKPHRNMYGVHKKGDQYNHDRPANDVKFGYVEIVDQTKSELVAEAEERNIDLPKKGSGKNGAVVKDDIAEAIEKA